MLSSNAAASATITMFRSQGNRLASMSAPRSVPPDICPGHRHASEPKPDGAGAPRKSLDPRKSRIQTQCRGLCLSGCRQSRAAPGIRGSVTAAGGPPAEREHALAEHPSEVVRLACTKCERRGGGKATLIERYGADANMVDLRLTLAAG